MPVRHEDDFQRKTIKTWDSWVDEAIREAQERGEFDNLPDQGKPIRLEETPFAPDMGSALRTLRNAGYAPTWMEIDREITQGKKDLDAFLQRSVLYLDSLKVSGAPEILDLTREPMPGRWRRFIRWLTFANDRKQESGTWAAQPDREVIRARMREQYLDRAAAIDKKITEFHAALPRNLWHLERMRLTPEMATRTFAASCPNITPLSGV